MKLNLVSFDVQPIGNSLNSISTISKKSTDNLVTETPEEEEDKNRDQWGSQREFLLSCIASSVGLGNVWRFPYTAYQNGGGAFLIPYLIVLFLIGKPLYFMELTLGQFTNLGQAEVWRCAPIFKGLGIGQAVSTVYLTSYINALMAICIFYFFACFASRLPWTWCDPTWADMETCRDEFSNSTNTSIFYNTSPNNTKPEAPAEQYNRLYVLNLSDGIHDLGQLDWRLSLCLLGSWTFIFITVMKGVKSSGKVSYVTAIFPYLVLVTLLVVGCTMEGAKEGVLYFVQPQWEELKNIRVWYKACEQLFFSLGVGYGYLTVYSSYSPFDHTVNRDAMIVSVIDTLTSLLAGFTIFSVLGALSHHLGVHISQVVDSGPSLAFIAYPKALSRLDAVPQLWACLFFLMLFTLGVGSVVSHMAGIMSIMQDFFPKVKKWQMALGICIFCFLFGLFYTNQAGQYVLTLIDNYGTGFTTFIWAILETVALMWVYGLKNFCNDIGFMLGYRIGFFWRICWGFVIPVGLTFIFIYAVVSYQPLKMGSYEYPDWANGIGWLIACIPLVQFPIWGVYYIYKQDGSTWSEKFIKSLRPEASWGPRKLSDKLRWLQNKNKEEKPVILERVVRH